MIYDLFIRRPRLAMVISIVVTLAGILSLQVLPVSQYPDIAPPTVSVSASYPGADAQVVEESVLYGQRLLSLLARNCLARLEGRGSHFRISWGSFNLKSTISRCLFSGYQRMRSKVSSR